MLFFQYHMVNTTSSDPSFAPSDADWDAWGSFTGSALSLEPEHPVSADITIAAAKRAAIDFLNIISHSPLL